MGAWHEGHKALDKVDSINTNLETIILYTLQGANNKMARNSARKRGDKGWQVMGACYG